MNSRGGRMSSEKKYFNGWIMDVWSVTELCSRFMHEF